MSITVQKIETFFPYNKLKVTVSFPGIELIRADNFTLSGGFTINSSVILLIIEIEYDITPSPNFSDTIFATIPAGTFEDNSGKLHRLFRYVGDHSGHA